MDANTGLQLMSLAALAIGVGGLSIFWFFARQHEKKHGKPRR